VEYVISGGKNYELPQNILFLTLSVITEKDVSTAQQKYIHLCELPIAEEDEQK
jgi:hypothetical protein